MNQFPPLMQRLPVSLAFANPSFLFLLFIFQSELAFDTIPNQLQVYSIMARHLSKPLLDPETQANSHCPLNMLGSLLLNTFSCVVFLICFSLNHQELSLPICPACFICLFIFCQEEEEWKEQSALVVRNFLLSCHLASQEHAVLFLII